MAIKEVMNLLDEYADMWYGEVGTSTQQNSDDDEENEESIEDAFAKELKGLKGSAKTKRFHWLDIGIDCCFFIKMEDPIVPVDFTVRVLNDLYETKKKKTRYTLRLVPLYEICTATMEHVMELAKRIIPEHFQGDNIEPMKYSVVFNRRNSDRLNRDELIPAFVELIGDRHTVDIKTPEIVVIVEAFRGVCGISVTKDFYRLKKFNLESIFDEENGKRAYRLEKRGVFRGDEASTSNPNLIEVKSREVTAGKDGEAKSGAEGEGNEESSKDVEGDEN
ncbi:hypothetical protein HDU97_002534 [Phlyctochytrium planicorne]|nr:hypothetical protein HDU97_002534 [Phlyctochytrium planicorne]